MGRTQHGRARSKNKITHNCCNFGIMGGLAPVTGRPYSHIASRGANRNPVPCNLDCDKARKWLAGDNPLGKNMLSVNPTYSGCVGFLKKSNRKCNCGSSPSGIDMRFINYGANKFYVLIFTSAAKPHDLDAPEYWAQHYQAYLKQISLFGNSVIDHQFIWFGTPIMHISSRNGLHITYGEGQLSETEALRAQHGFITKIMPQLPWSPLLVISTFQPVNQEDTLTEETRQALASLAEHPSTNVVTYHETQDISKDVVGFYGHADNAVVNQALTSILKNADKKKWIPHQSWEKYADREILTVLVNHKAVSDDPQHYYFLKERIRNLSNISVSTEDLINLNLHDINRKLYYNNTVKITMVATTYETAVYCLAWMEQYGVHHDDAIIVILDHDEDIQQLMNEERNIIASSHKANPIPSLISAMAVGAHDLVHYKLLKKQQSRPYLTGNSSATQTSTYTGTAETNWPTSTTCKFELDDNKSTYTITDNDNLCDGVTWINKILRYLENQLNSQIKGGVILKIFFCNSDVWKPYGDEIYTLKDALVQQGILGFDDKIGDVLSQYLSTECNVKLISLAPCPNQVKCKIGDKSIYIPKAKVPTESFPNGVYNPLSTNELIEIVDLINSTAGNAEGILNNTELCIASVDAIEYLKKLIAPKYIDYSKITTKKVYTDDQDRLYNANSSIELFNYIGRANNDHMPLENVHLNNPLSPPSVFTVTTTPYTTIAVRYQFEYYYTETDKRWSQLSEPLLTTNAEDFSVPFDTIAIVSNNRFNYPHQHELGVRWYISDADRNMNGKLVYEYPNDKNYFHIPSKLDKVFDDMIIQWTFPSKAKWEIFDETITPTIYFDSIITNNDTNNLLEKDVDGNTTISNIMKNRPYTNQHGSTGLQSNQNTLLGFINERYEILKEFITFGSVQDDSGEFLIIPKRCIYSKNKFTDQLLPQTSLPAANLIDDVSCGSSDGIPLLSEAIYHHSGKILCWIYESDIDALKNKYSSQIPIKMLDANEYKGKIYKDQDIGDLITSINCIPTEISTTDKLNYVQFHSHQLAALSLHSIYQLYTLNEKHGVYLDIDDDSDDETKFTNIDASGIATDHDIPTARFESMVENFPGKIQQIMFEGLPAYNIFGKILDGFMRMMGPPSINDPSMSGLTVIDQGMGDTLCGSSVDPGHRRLQCDGRDALYHYSPGGTVTSKKMKAFLGGEVACTYAATLEVCAEISMIGALVNELRVPTAKNNTTCDLTNEATASYYTSMQRGTKKQFTRLTQLIEGGLSATDSPQNSAKYNELVKIVPSTGPNSNIAANILPDEKVPNFNISAPSPPPLSITVTCKPRCTLSNGSGEEGVDDFEGAAAQFFPGPQTYTLKDRKPQEGPSHNFVRKDAANSTIARGILLRGTGLDISSVDLPNSYSENQKYYPNIKIDTTANVAAAKTYIDQLDGKNTTTIVALENPRDTLYDIGDIKNGVYFKECRWQGYTMKTSGGTMKQNNDLSSKYKWEFEPGGKIFYCAGSSYPPIDDNNNSVVDSKIWNSWDDHFTVYKMEGSAANQDLVIYPALKLKSADNLDTINAALWICTGVVGGDLQRDPRDTTKYKDLSRHVDASGVPKTSFSTCIKPEGVIGLLIQSSSDLKWKYYQLKLNDVSDPTYGWYEVTPFFFNDKIWETGMYFNPEIVMPEKVTKTQADDNTFRPRYIGIEKNVRNLAFTVQTLVVINYSDTTKNTSYTLNMTHFKDCISETTASGDTFIVRYAANADAGSISSCKEKSSKIFGWYPEGGQAGNKDRTPKWGEGLGEKNSHYFKVDNRLIRGPITKPNPGGGGGTAWPFGSCFSILSGGGKKDTNPFLFPQLTITDNLKAAQPGASDGGGGAPGRRIMGKKSGSTVFKLFKLDKTSKENLLKNLTMKYPSKPEYLWQSEEGKNEDVTSREIARRILSMMAAPGDDNVEYWISTNERHHITHIFEMEPINPSEGQVLPDDVAPFYRVGVRIRNVVSIAATICPRLPYGQARGAALPPGVSTGRDGDGETQNLPTLQEACHITKYGGVEAFQAAMSQILCDYNCILTSVDQENTKAIEMLQMIPRGRGVFLGDNVYSPFLGTWVPTSTADVIDSTTSVRARWHVGSDELHKDLLIYANDIQTQLEGGGVPSNETVRYLVNQAKSMYPREFCDKATAAGCKPFAAGGGPGDLTPLDPG